MQLEEVYKHIMDGEAVLFIGAGFSREAVNVKDQKMKDAVQLSEDLCNEMGIDVSKNLGAVADYYLGDKSSQEYIKNAQKLITKLQDNFSCKTVDDAQKIIASGQWIRVYTTNYDDVFEKAGNQASSYDRTPMTMKNTVEQIRSQDSVVHLNGYIRNLDVVQLEDDFKLCTRSYLVDDFKASEISGLFYRDIKDARAVVFIGVSFDYDLDIQRIIYEHNSCKDKFVFIDKKLNEKQINVLEDRKKNLLGQVHHIGLEEFALGLDAYRKNYDPVKDNIIYRSFEKISLRKINIDKGGIRDLWSLFTIGKLDKSVLCSHINDDDYLVRRSVINEIVSNIEMNKLTVNIIHSNLGNGKTCLMEYLMYHLAEKYNVFRFVECYSDFTRELKSISKLTGKKILFFENYNLYLKALEQVKYYSDEDWDLVLSCRTYINFNSIYKLAAALKLDMNALYEFDIDCFTDEETDKVIHSLKNIDQAEFKDISRHKAQKLIKDKMQNKWSNTVLYLFGSQAISAELDRIYTEIQRNRNNKEVVIAAIINNVVGMNLSYSQLLNLIQVRQVDINLGHDENIAELLHVSDGKIEIKSSLLSLYLIRSKNLYSEVIQVMKKMVLNANRLLDDEFEMVKRLLISTSNISELFYKRLPHFEYDKSGNELAEEVLEYFADISKVKYYEKNAFFWLQYAMACMDIKEYALAENNFLLAHKYEREKQIESYQIKVQYGRFLLEKAIFTGDENKPIKVLAAVAEEWKQVLLNDEAQKFYVYKQVYQYKQFLEVYASQFTEAEYNKADKLTEMLIKTINKCDKNDHRKKSRDEALEIMNASRKLLLRKIVSK